MGEWLPGRDRAILRELAGRVREFAEETVNQECVRQWYLHDENRAERPLILTETDGGFPMIMPEYRPRCETPWAQKQEGDLRLLLLHAEVIQDDFPIEPVMNCPWPIQSSGYGVETGVTRTENAGERSAYHIDPAFPNFPEGLDRLRFRTHSVDRAAADAEYARMAEVYDGLLGVRMRGNPWWTMGLTIIAINFIGLEELMVYMYEEPEALHQLMAFLRDDNLRKVEWLEAEGLLTLNNENDYNGSGSRGYTRRLPQPDWTPGAPARSRDLWTLLESQETVGVGPDLYAEFIFPYENAIAERFGSVYYGCCEPVHTRWHVLKRMANLKRVSVSPWCDEAVMAEALGTHYGYSRKPNPTLISTAVFDEEAIRADLRTTMELTRAHGCSAEIVMKDVHTLHGEPDRLPRWVRLAREVTAEVYGVPVG